MKKAYRKAHVKQHGQSDCAVACMAALVNYYGGSVMLERLRELSGTGKQGTTALGIVQAGPEVGLEIEGFEAELQHLKEHKGETILHVVKDKQINHFVVCYGYEKGKFIISDPAEDVRYYTEEELVKIWQTKTLLTVKPTQNFQRSKEVNKDKLFWVRKLIEEDLNLLVMALLLGVAMAVLSMSTAVFSQKLIDNILPGNDVFKLAVGLSILFFLLIVRSVFTLIRTYFLLRQSRDFNNRIIKYFYGKLMYLPKAFFDNRKIGELVARMNDTGRIQGSLSYLVTNLMIDILMVVISSTFILVYSPGLGGIAMISIPMFFLIAYLYHNVIVRSQRNVMIAHAKNESNYVNTIGGIGEIKVMNKESLFEEITTKIYGFFQDKNFELGIVGMRVGIVSGIGSSVLMMCIISLGATMVMDPAENFKLGEFMAIMQMIGMLMPAASQLAMLNLQLQEARVAFDRMYEFTSLKPEYDIDEDNAKTKFDQFEQLELDNITFRFPGRSQLLKGISLSVKKGEMISIIGESGCGKSTTLQILQQFYKQETGDFRVNGKPIEEYSVQSWRDIIAVVPQKIKLFNGTLVENIVMGNMPGSEEELFEFFWKHDMAKFFDKFPQTYNTVLGEEGVNISGGQEQLVALARAIYKQPQLLLLDEATSAMDRNTELFIIDMLQKLKGEIGIVFVTHRVKTASRADKIYVMENGIIETSGTHKELMATKNRYSEAWQDYLEVHE